MKQNNLIRPLHAVKGGLIVSCQALEDEPLYGSSHMEVMTKAALVGGARGIRANGASDIAAIRSLTTKPIIGISKQLDADGKIFITPNFPCAASVVEAGADMVALDCTLRRHADSEELESLIRQIRTELKVPVMADCSSVEETLRAERLGADVVATTLALGTEPDFGLLAKIVEAVQVPVIAEGNYWYPAEVVQAIQLGAHAVVVGSAITRPQLITGRFVAALEQSNAGQGVV